MADKLNAVGEPTQQQLDEAWVRVAPHCFTTMDGTYYPPTHWHPLPANPVLKPDPKDGDDED